MAIAMINPQLVHLGVVCSAGVPPASSPSVSLDEGPGGETPPALAAEDGRAATANIQMHQFSITKLLLQ